MREEQTARKNSVLREYLDSLLVTVILALFGTTFILQAFKIPSSSMEKTLLVGDHLLVNKFIFAGEADGGFKWFPYREVRRGDIVVFKYPFSPHQHFVKRVVGLPGDRLKIVDRQVYVNGHMLPEPYKIHRRSRMPGRLQDNFPGERQVFPYSNQPEEFEWAQDIARWVRGDDLVLPPNKYFVLGDNRDNSKDSRYWGFIDRRNIIGRPLLIYWSFNPAPRRPRGGTAAWDALTGFFSRTRWHRLFQWVR